MIQLALRLLRPYLIVAAALTVAGTGYLLYAGSVVQGQLDRAGTPGCHDPNICSPNRVALSAVLHMELAAVLVPSLLGLILGVGLFAREREDDTITFALTQSISRSRWVLVKLGGALAAGIVCSAVFALVFRLFATRYTALADDTYEVLATLHCNNVAFMVMQTTVLVAIGGVLGLVTGRTLITLVLSVVAWPIVQVVPIVMALLGVSGGGGDIISDADPLGYSAAAVLVCALTALVLLASRLASRLQVATQRS